MTDAPTRSFAVTCLVPKGAGERLRVEVAGRTVTLTSQDGFTRTFEVPPGAATERLSWQVYGDLFELRVPYRSPVPRTDERAAIA